MGIEHTSEVWEACNSNSTNAGLAVIFIDLKVSQMQNNGKRKTATTLVNELHFPN